VLILFGKNNAEFLRLFGHFVEISTHLIDQRDQLRGVSAHQFHGDGRLSGAVLKSGQVVRYRLEQFIGILEQHAQLRCADADCTEGFRLLGGPCGGLFCGAFKSRHCRAGIIQTAADQTGRKGHRLYRLGARPQRFGQVFDLLGLLGGSLANLDQFFHGESDAENFRSAFQCFLDAVRRLPPMPLELFGSLGTFGLCLAQVANHVGDVS